MDDHAAEDLLARGDLQGALAAYDALVAAGAGAEALAARGRLQGALGRAGAAEADLLAAAELEPTEPWRLQRLADMLSAAGRPHAAAAARARALGRAPWFDELRMNAAQSFFALEWLDAAYFAVRTLPEELTGWWRAARDRIVPLYRSHHRHARNMLGALRGDLCGAPGSPELAVTLFKVGRLRLAEHMAAELSARTPDAVDPVLLLARIRARRDGAAAGAAVLQGARERFAGNPRFDHALLALTHDAGDSAAVLALLESASPAYDNDEARLIRAIGLASLDRHDALRRACRDWLVRSPHSVAASGFVTVAHLAESRAPVEEPGAAAPVLAQFWDRPEPPEDVVAVMRSWTEQNPGLEVRRFDTDSAREHLRQAFGGGLAAVFDQCHHAAMQADLFRLGWLLSHGGVWADADERCIRPMGPVLAWAAAQELVAPLSGETPGYVHNLFLGARAGSRAVEAALETACATVDTEVRAGRRPDIWATTGPGLLTRTAAARLLAWSSGGEASGVHFLSSQQYGLYVRTEDDLAYKRDPRANWRTA